MSTSNNAPTKKPAKVPAKAPAKAITKSVIKPAVTPISKSANKSLATKAASTAVVKKIATTTELPKTVSKPASKTLTSKALIEKPIKAKKVKLVRDSFTIPKPEYLILDNLKLRAADLKHPVKKSELLRAGIKALAAMTDAQLLLALKAVPMLKTGRPSK
jgi:hypothetical protein